MDLTTASKTQSYPDWKDIARPLIQGFESCELRAYHGDADRPGLYSCGWGSTGADIDQDTVWSQEQADQRFETDLEKVGTEVDDLVTVPLTPNKKAALVSFAYNLGIGHFASSTLLRLLNAGDHAGAAEQFERWDLCDGKEVAGLLRRRLAEEAEFKGDNDAGQ